MTYHRIDKGTGEETIGDRDAMKLQLEDRGFYKRGAIKEFERLTASTGKPFRVATTWAFWEIRP